MNNHSGKHSIVFVLLVTLLLLVFSGCSTNTKASVDGRGYTHIALLSDLHLPGHLKDQKGRIIENLNSWDDLDAVAVLGDVTQHRGMKAEYEYAKTFFSTLKAPVLPITGNHDYLYEDEPGATGKNRKASPAVRSEKLERFKQLFSLEAIYYTKIVNGYLLVFLSEDDRNSSFLSTVSKEQLDWLETTLAANRKMPTVIFFHAPLEGTFSGKADNVGRADFFAQPSERIDRILQANRQVFLWVSGHIHFAPSHRSFNAAENLYKGRVLNLHNPDLNGSSYLSADDVKTTRHQGLVTNSLFLYPDRVVIRLYDHQGHAWLPGERVVSLPKL